ncbi:MAG: hypothetical protein MMC33_002126 [Icmadophila ericetorum]|nr:hypothetical protein [Icmadophila ericetorum]
MGSRIQVVPDPADRTDFDNAERGFIQALIPCKITSSDGSGRSCWDSTEFEFIENGDCPTDTANTSLWRQSQLCLKQGLFKVTDYVYQVRGLDVSNISFVETSPTGVIVIDPLISMECAAVALQMYQDNRPGHDVVALIYTHSHTDHFGGAEAITSLYPDVPIYAPDGFLDHAVSETVYAGTAMTRRSMYMYGDELPKDATGQIGAGLGMTASTGSTTLIPPTDKAIISTSPCATQIDGLDVTFQLTPGTEAPAEMNFHFPTYRALCMAENVTHTLHNIQTLRGALVRDAHEWSIYIDEAITLFADQTDVVFSSHHWPTWNNPPEGPTHKAAGDPPITTFMTQQRDMYAYLNDQTLRMLNDGMVGEEIAENFTLPDSLASRWYSQGYYGSLSHNVKAIYHRYMGWFDGNPAHLWEHPPVDSAQRYVSCLGGADAVIAKAATYVVYGDYRFAATLLNHVVFSDSSNQPAKKALAAVYRQLGYGAENGTWRNFYLSGALELETGPQAPLLATDAFQSSMALELNQLMDTMAVRLDGLAAQTQPLTSMDWYITDLNPKQQLRLTLSNGALTNRAFDTPPPTVPTLKCTLIHADLVNLVLGITKTIEDNPNIVSEGDTIVWTTLMGLLVVPNAGFAIVTPD